MNLSPAQLIKVQKVLVATMSSQNEQYECASRLSPPATCFWLLDVSYRIIAFGNHTANL
jgi:hypothetical protein